MQIQSGKLYENKTWKYLYPTLKIYGSQFMTRINKLFKLGVGLGDSNIEDIKEEPCIYILLETKLCNSTTTMQQYRENLVEFLEWIKTQSYYVADYIYGGLESREQHMVVIKVPDMCKESVVKFKLGKYSEMYSPEVKSLIFKMVSLEDKNLEEKINRKTRGILAVLNKDRSVAPDFLETLNEEFGTDLMLWEISDHELDFPPFVWEEIFNYKQVEVCQS